MASPPRVAVVGAGIVGAACAFHLARSGARVTVLERASSPATGSTGRSAAGIRHQFSLPVNVDMSRYSAQEYAAFESLTGEPSGYRRVGYLFLVPVGGWDAWLELVRMQRSRGARVEALERAELEARFPYIGAAGLAGGTFGPDDGVVDPHALTLGYLAEARRQGARTVFDCEVSEAVRTDDWTLRTNAGEFRADVVVNAAGPYAGELAARAGLRVPVVPVRRNVYATSPFAGFPHPTPLVVDVASGVWLRSEGERFIFGLSNTAEPVGDNLAVDWVWLEETLTRALPRFEFLERAGLDRRACWAGLYEITPDSLPVLGWHPGADGWLDACGFSGHGVQHAAATGRAVSELVHGGVCSTFDLAPFALSRFDGALLTAERNVV